ncbi:MAG: hypothetical protein Q9210_004000 [Variospora velana]
MVSSLLGILAVLTTAHAAPTFLKSILSNPAFLLPQSDPTPLLRAGEVAIRKAGFSYGPPLLGNSSFFPSGPLGDLRVAADVGIFIKNAAYITLSIEKETPTAGGFTNVSSYELLYKDQWKLSNPSGVAPGFFPIIPSISSFQWNGLPSVPFRLDASIQLATLYRSSAYFYISPNTGDFLPLAIKTNVGSDLIYTPLDEPDDWLLAKMLFNNNDYFFGQIFHLAESHAVAEIVYLAALRTMSGRHPIRAFLDRVMYQAYAARPVGAQVLFNPGGFFDQGAAVNHNAVFSFVDEFYPTLAGPFRCNYLYSNLKTRGLVDCPYGPSLKHFPFAKDATAIVASLRDFFANYVYTYYPTRDLLTSDREIQDWIAEANGAARVLDFPSAPLDRRTTLIDVLTHIAYLTGVSHHALKSNAPSMAAGTLPFHPSAFYKPIPAAKGVSDLVSYLPNLNQSLNQVTLTMRFNRPALREEKGELVEMFSGSAFLKGQPVEVRKGAERFRAEMEAFSRQVESRGFNAEGLNEGCPFLWKVLDPRKIPFFLSV